MLCLGLDWLSSSPCCGLVSLHPWNQIASRTGTRVPMRRREWKWAARMGESYGGIGAAQTRFVAVAVHENGIRRKACWWQMS